MKAEQITLKMTCGACPEQYDAYCNGAMVGYLRLRHGTFTVEVPDVRGELVFHAEPEGDGMFESDEREGYLRQAREAIAAYFNDVHHAAERDAAGEGD